MPRYGRVRTLQRQVVMFLCRVGDFLACELLKGSDYAEAGVARLASM